MLERVREDRDTSTRTTARGAQGLADLLARSQSNSTMIVRSLLVVPVGARRSGVRERKAA